MNGRNPNPSVARYATRLTRRLVAPASRADQIPRAAGKRGRKRNNWHTGPTDREVRAANHQAHSGVGMPSFSSPKRTSDPSVSFGGLSGLPLEEQAPKRVRFGSGSSVSSATSGEGGQDSPGTGTGDMALLEQQLGSKRFQIDFDWRDTFKQGPGDTPRADDEMRAFLAGTTLNPNPNPILILPQP